MVAALVPGTDWLAITAPPPDTVPPAAVTMLLDAAVVWPTPLADVPPEPLPVPPVVAVVSPDPDPLPPVPWLSEPEPPHADSDISAAAPAAIMIIRSPA